MKILIMTDLEGVAGVVDFEEQTSPQGKYFEKSKELLTDEVNTICQVLEEKGAKDILIIDGHGCGGIIPWNIHPKAKLLHGKVFPKHWEFEKGWDALFLVGHHSMGCTYGVLNHSYSHTEIVKMSLNGQEIGEIGMNIFLAGYFEIPVIFISGDDYACEEASKYVPNIKKAVVKWSIAQTSSITLSHEMACEIIRNTTIDALENISEIHPVKISGKCELIIKFSSSSLAYQYLKRPYVESVDPTTIKITGKDFLELWDRWFY